MAQRPPIELSTAKVCKACGENNVVMLANLAGNPVCKQCGEWLPVNDMDRFVCGNMYAFAIAAGETVKVD